MPADPSKDRPDLTTFDRALAESFARELQAAADSRFVPRLEDFLARSRSTDRSNLFRELLRIEWRKLLASSIRPDVVSYVTRFPHFDNVVLGLAKTELERDGTSRPQSRSPRESSGQAGRHEPNLASTTDNVSKPRNALLQTDDFSQSDNELSEKPQIPSLPTSLSRYQIKRPLGEGRFGQVFLAYDEVLYRDVAIKITTTQREKSLNEMLSEARRLAQLRHPNIVTVFDAQVSGDSVYIISDYVVGVDLKQWLADHEPDWRTTARIVAELADALGYAHAASTIHRDVKPANVVLTGIDRNAGLEQLVPVLVDFGLALTEAEANVQVRGKVAGTPAYMSPEQIRGLAHRIDGRTDIYSLGVVFYEMLCGRLPFRSTDWEELARQVCLDAPQPPRQIVQSIPQVLEDACLQAISKEISQRFSTAGDFAENLRGILATDAAGASDSWGSGLKSSSGAWGRRPLQPTPTALPDDETPGSTSRFERVDTDSERRLYEAGRRQLTALYCRLLNASELAEQFDPEEERELLHDYQQACHASAERYGGTIERQLGEDILIYFGFPTAQEDAGKRAMRTGLAFLEAVDQLNQRLRRERNAEMIVGIAAHTSEVVAEESTDLSEPSRISVVGNAPKVAAALSEHADGKTVCVTSATCKLVRGQFSIKSLGIKSLRGFRRQVETFAIEGETDELSSPAAKSRDTPFVGRTAELDLLKQRWSLVQSGRGQVGMLCGDAGIGKSRLLRFFKHSLGQEPRIWIECRCSPYHSGSVLYPIINLFQRVLNLEQVQSPEDQVGRLEKLLDDYQLCKDELVPLLAPLLSIPLGRGYSPLTLTSQQRKRKTIESLLAIPLAMAEHQPVLFVVEDLHWSDPSTLDLLGQLMDRARLSRLMVVVTFRPDFQPPWPMRPHVFPVMLTVLDDELAKQLVASTCGSQRPSDELAEYIVQRTDGVPIFVEELTRFLLDSNFLKEENGELQLAGPIDSLAIPSTLQDSLMARLDRLGDAKEVAQLAATLGRDFDYALLKAASSLAEEDLQDALGHLVEADLLLQRGYPPHVRYMFKHVLVRDEAYHSLLRRTREHHHLKIAQTLDRQFPHVADAQPELLAHHYTEANLPQQAIDYWWRAGAKARERSAYAEAIQHLSRGLDIIVEQEKSNERDQLEFKFQFALGVSHIAARGYAAHEVGQIFGRARKLAERAQSGNDQFFVLRMTWAWHVVRAEFGLCRELADQIEHLSRQQNNPGIQLEGHFAQALTHYYRGDFDRSREHAEKGFKLYDRDHCQKVAERTGQNSGITIQCYLAWSLWCLGYPDQALARMQEAVQMARELNHLYSLAYAIAHLGRLQDYCRLGNELQQTGTELLECGREYAFPFWEAIGRLEIGRALLHAGKPAEAIEETRCGLEIHERTGAQLSMPYHYSLIAEAHIQLGHTKRARTALDDAWTAMRKSEEAAHQSDLYRLEGAFEAARERGNPQHAQSCFQQAIDAARRQQAKSFELRAALHHVRLFPPTDANDPNLGSLHDCYDWFSEGLQLPDLVEAKAILSRFSMA